MPRRRALITGIAGQDGSYLAELLLSKDYDVSGMVRRLDRPAKNLTAIAERLTLLEGDLLDPASLRAVVDETRPHELYHLAAPSYVPASWDDPAEVFAAIADATAVLVAAVQGTGTKFYLAASSEVFGDAGQSPQDEDSLMRPRSPYGVAKLAALELVRTEREQRGVHAAAGILFNHESPRRPEHFLPRKVTRAAAAIKLGKQETVELGSLDAIRDWSYAPDMARGAWLALQAPRPDTYVFASGVGRTVGELVNTAFAAAGVDPNGRIRVNPAYVRDPEPTPPVGDPSLARVTLGWAAGTTFEEMIAEMVAADLVALSR